MAFNTIELLKYEKAHSVRSLVLTLKYPATYLHLFEWQECSLLLLVQV